MTLKQDPRNSTWHFYDFVDDGRSTSLPVIYCSIFILSTKGRSHREIPRRANSNYAHPKNIRQSNKMHSCFMSILSHRRSWSACELANFNRRILSLRFSGQRNERHPLGVCARLCRHFCTDAVGVNFSHSVASSIWSFSLIHASL